MMKFLIVIAVALATATAFETCGKKGVGSRIVNGLPAAHGEFPWQVSLRYKHFGQSKMRHICGGKTCIRLEYSGSLCVIAMQQRRRQQQQQQQQQQKKEKY